MDVNQILATIFTSIISLIAPNPEIVKELMLPPKTLLMRDLTPIEIEAVRDLYFREFITTLSEIENNYRRAGTLDSKKLMTGALQGALKYGTGDKYSLFIPKDEEEEFLSFLNGEDNIGNGKTAEKIVVRWRPLKNKFAYIRISKLCNIANKQFDRVINHLITFKPRGLVIDLRNNPGGLVGVVADILLYLVKPGEIAVKFKPYVEAPYDKYSSINYGYPWRQQNDPPEGFEFLRSLPIVVLINRKSASASEIMAGALRDLGRAKLVGERSFGKGIYQSLTNSTFGISKVTAGNWLTPKGISIHGKGLEPDIKIKDTRSQDDEEPYDAQLNMAVKLLRSNVSRKIK